MSNYKTEITTKNFRSRLNSVSGSLNTASEKVQELLEFAGTYYMKHKNALYLSTLRDKVHNTRGINVAKFDAYVTDRWNVAKSKNKNGEMIFKMVKGEKLPVENNLGSREWDTTVERDKAARADKTLDDFATEVNKHLKKGLKGQTPEHLAAWMEVARHLKTATAQKHIQNTAAKIKAELNAVATDTPEPEAKEA